MRNPRYGYGIQINFQDKRIYIKIPSHPHCNSRGYVLLSRLIVEKLLGRYLEPKERIHHIDGNRYNNAPENLELFESQSPHAKMHGIKRILNEGLRKLRDYNWLEDQYIIQYKSLTQIGNELNCNARTIANNLDKLGIPRRKHTMSPQAYASRLKGAKAKKPRRRFS